MSAPRVSVVIPTFQRAASLPGLIEALEAQTLPIEDFDVRIVDDASRDETPVILDALAARARVKVRVMRNERNTGPGAARNRGWRSSDAPIIAFTDDDCVPAPGWLEAGLAAFDQGSAGVVQGCTLPDPRTPAKSWAKTLRVDRLSKLYESCNIFYRTEVLSTAGGFDEEITVPFGEDTALGWEARRQGVTTDFAPDALVYHSVTQPGARYWFKYAMMHGNFPKLVRRFPEMRRELLWLQLFTKRRHAALISAVAGVAAGAFWWPGFALAIPYVWRQTPRSLKAVDLRDHLLGTAFDAAVLASLIMGSVRERTLVL
jgi:glycosyltransferase involved in cell wall biosynthesis